MSKTRDHVCFVIEFKKSTTSSSLFFPAKEIASSILLQFVPNPLKLFGH